MDAKKINHSIGNKKVEKVCQQIVDFLISNADKKFFVCSHDSPDPDSLSSGFAMLHILDFFGIEANAVYYCNDISHAQNKTMQNILQLPLKRWNQKIEQEAQELKEDAVFIFVDCAGNNETNMSIPFEPKIVIDHHKTIPTADIVLHDDVGACATLMLDLMLHIPPKESADNTSYCFDTDDENIADLCTALAIGIKTDTLSFIRENTTEYDFIAHQILIKYMSRDKFNRIDNYELPEYMFDYEKIAWENKILKNPRVIAGLGFLKSSHGDCIPHIAERFMRLEGIQTAVVFGILEDDENVGMKIRAAVRTISAAYDCDTLTKSLFGEHNGGAKHGAGGAIVDLSYDVDLLDEEDRKKLWELQKSQIEKRFEKITGK